MEKPKKLKDLKKGDRVCIVGICSVVLIPVVSAKRTGSMVEVVLDYDGTEYVCCGHALGYVMAGYNRKYKIELSFTSNIEIEKQETDARNRDEYYNRIGRAVENIIYYTKKLGVL